MPIKSKLPATIDDYIAACPRDVQPILERIRQTVLQVAPEATEVISYRMPAFKLNGIIIYFAAFKNYIGIFPPVKGDPKLAKALERYAGPKGNLRLPLDEPVPYDLIKRIVLHRVKQNCAKVPKRKKATAREG